MRRIVPFFLAVAAIVAAVALGASSVVAFSAGIAGYSGNPAINFGASCGACHGGGSTPVVQLTGPAVVAPNTAHTYLLTIQSTNIVSQTAAGFDVSTTGGLLASLGPDTQILDGEVTHTATKPNDSSGLTSFAFQWQAPDVSPQIVTLYAAGNSVNQDGLPFGDAHANASLQVLVASPTAVRLTALAASAPPNQGGSGQVMLGVAVFVLAGGLAGWWRLGRRKQTSF